jgi:hypothetical protein
MSDPLANAYRELAESLHEALARHGLALEVEHHHARPGGSRYVVMAGEEQAACLSWDGKASCFRLECCRKQAGATGAWEMICEERFDPERDGPERIAEMARAVVGAIEAKMLH